ncbi:MAG TPA: FG-GAP-like repeat-containing protein [Polyangiaceae bacterium]
MAISRIKAICSVWMLVSLSTAGLVSCGAGDGSDVIDPLGTVEAPLYYASTKLWPQREIPVCWWGTGFATEKEWVRSVLDSKRSWSAAGNVIFTGWQDCPTGALASGIRISVTASNGVITAATYGLGRPTNGGPLDMMLDFSSNAQGIYTTCTDNALSRENCIKAVALHEFGHAIAFQHEHNRADRPEWCTEPEQGGGNGEDATFGNFDVTGIMSYCASTVDLSGTERRGTEYLYGQPYSDPPRHRDMNGDRRADILCWDARTATRWGDFASSSGSFDGSDWGLSNGTNPFNCVSSGSSVRRVFKGDFNGDGRFDLLCQDVTGSQRFIDYASTSGRFEGTNWTKNTAWCNHQTGRLMVGDFNNDNRDDLLCRDAADGRLWIDYASTTGTFDGTDWSTTGVGCTGNGRQYIGDFNGDNRDDLLCHYPFGLSHLGPIFAVSLADSAGRFAATTIVGDGFCTGQTQEIHVGYFNQDARADLLCHDTVAGTKFIRYTGTSGNLGGSGSWNSWGQWCNHSGSQLSTGDFNGDGRDDILCFDVNNANKWIDYANGSGQFFTLPGFFQSNGWCSHSAGEFH